MMRHLFTSLCVLAFIVVGGAPRLAHASKAKVVVTPIDGDTNNELHKSLSSALTGDDFTVASLKETTKAIKSIGGLDDDATDKDFGKLADAASADVVVAGKLDGSGDGKTLKIKLYVKGKKSKKFSVQFGNPKSEKFKTTMRKTITDKIGAINKSGDDQEDAEADAAPAPKKKKHKGDDEAAESDAVKPMKKVKKKGDDEAAESDDAAPVKKAKKKKGDDDDTAEADDADDAPKKKAKKKKKADDDDADETAEGDSPMKGSPHAPNRDAIRVDFGIGVANRTLAFNSRSFTDGAGAPHPYSNSPVPSGHIAAELFPFAFQDAHSPQAGLGFWGDFDKTISLTLQSIPPDGTMQAVKAKATQQRWSVGVAYRILFSKSDLSPSATLGLGYGNQEFLVDRSALMGAVIDLPDTDYKAVEPMAAIRIPFAPAVALVAQGRGLLITDAGTIVKADQYGQAKVFGVQVEGGLDITFAQKFALRAMGFFNQVGYTFTGVGEKANDRDGDPTTKDVFGALDRAVGATITLGVLY